MAPKKPTNPLDPDRIDISLDLIGEGSLAAISQLTQQMSIMSAFLASTMANSPEGQAAASHILANTMRQGPGVVVGSGSVSGPANTPPVQDGHGLSASRAFADEDERLLQREGGRGPFRRFYSNTFKDGFHPLQALDKEADFYGANERVQNRRRGQNGPSSSASNPYGMLYSGHMGQGGSHVGGVSSSASIVDPRDPMWRQNLMSNPTTYENAQEGYKLPPGGLSMNFQDQLGLGADFFARVSDRKFQAEVKRAEAAAQIAALSGAPASEVEQMYNEQVGGITAGRGAGRASLALRLLEEHGAAPIQLAKNLKRHAAEAYAYGSGFTQAGIQAGNDPGGTLNIPFTDIGIRNPLDFFKSNSAAREGLNQRINIQRLRMKGGIDGGQAQAIVGGLAGSGWTGEEGQNAAFDAISPLVQQGQNPEIVVQAFDYLMRNGNTNMADFVKTFDKLGPAAKAARMSLDEYQQGIMSFAETARGLGAQGASGAQLGVSTSAAFGLPPQVVAGLLSNGLVQANMTKRYGILPNAAGLMTPTMLANSTGDALDMVERMSSGFAKKSIVDETGKVISGRSYQDVEAAALMSQMTGTPITAEMYKNLREKRPLMKKAALARELVDNADTNRLARDRHNSASIKLSRGAVKRGDWIPAHEGDPGAVSAGNGRWAKQATKDGETTVENPGRFGHMVEEKYNGRPNQAGPAIANFHATDAALKALLPGQTDKDYKRLKSQYDKIIHETGGKRTNDARNYITERMKTPMDQPPGTTVYVKFKGAADKFFQQDNTDRASRSGGQSHASTSLLPQVVKDGEAVGEAIVNHVLGPLSPF